MYGTRQRRRTEKEPIGVLDENRIDGMRYEDEPDLDVSLQHRQQA